MSKLCAICQKNDPDKKNSHLIPIGYMKHSVGKRNYERSYNIGFGDASVDVYYGRSVLDDHHPGRKPNHHALDYIFCSKCETLLGKLEDSVLPIINDKIFSESYTQTYRVDKIEDYEVIHIPDDHGVPVLLFYYSMIWRMELGISLKYESHFSDIEPFEAIRLALNSYLYNKDSNSGEVNNLLDNYGLGLYCERTLTNPTEMLALPPPSHEFPLPYMLYHYYVSLHKIPFNEVPDKMKVFINQGKLLKIIVFPEKRYNNIKKKVADSLIGNMMNNVYKKVMHSKKMKLRQAKRYVDYKFKKLPKSMDSFDKINSILRK
jgi:hypothetical protein